MIDFAQALRFGAQQAHTTAENSLFMKCFLKGIVVCSAFQRFLCSLYRVYSALEAELSAHAKNRVVGPMVVPQLWRWDKLAADLAFYLGDSWGAKGQA